MNIKHKIIHIPEREIWIESSEEFLHFDAVDLEIEHSLFSISLWESKYHKPYLSSEKSAEEALDYLTMMVISGLENVTDVRSFFLTLPEKYIKEINDYINDPMTATTFSDKKDETDNKKEIITAEILYYAMTAQNIPFECEMWHVNKLVTLIKVCGIKNQPEDKKKKRMTSSDLALRRARMQAARAKYAKH